MAGERDREAGPSPTRSLCARCHDYGRKSSVRTTQTVPIPEETVLPEGDTIWRAAQRVRAALEGRVIDAAASSTRTGLADRVKGASVEAVESRGKHLLVHFGNGATLHTHLGMQGRWRVARVRQPMTSRQAGAVLSPKWLFLESSTARAVCEHAAVIELLARKDLHAHPVLRHLGPDILVPGELEDLEPVSRARASSSPTVGELLLDQRVVAGIGNIYRCETLFICGINPSTRVSALGDAELLKLVDAASRLMTSSLERRHQVWVYRRAGLACRRCGTRIRSAMLGARNPRTAYWCPHCQPEREGPETG